MLHSTHEYLYPFSATRIPLAAVYDGPADEAAVITKFGTQTTPVLLTGVLFYIEASTGTDTRTTHVQSTRALISEVNYLQNPDKGNTREIPIGR
jgi:hypothetical protein